MVSSFLAGTSIALSLLASEPSPKPAERWKEWLDHEVAAIVSAEERRLFLELETDASRERFVETFWAARDPTPGTRRNEFREEHMRRLAYADEQFGRDGTRPGARSDRGRMYVLLGEPQDRRFFHSSAYGTYPSELWFYQAPKDVGLPAFFYLLFFKPHGVGDYKMYSPVRDGPEALVGGFLPGISRQAALAQLGEVDPEMQKAAISLDPGAGADYASGSVSIASDLMLAKIENLPNTLADTRYLSRYAAPRTDVRTDISYSQFDLQPIVTSSFDPDGVGWIHYEVLVPPANLGLEERDPGLAGAYELFLVLKDELGRTVQQRTEPISVGLKPEMASQALAAPLAIQGRIGAVPGAYEVSFLLRNLLSGQFGVGTAHAILPAEGGRAELFGLYLAFHAEPIAEAIPDIAPPFEALGFRCFPAREGRFGPDERPWLVARVRYPQGADAPPKLIKTISLLRGGQEIWGYMGFLAPNPAFDGGVVTIAEELRLTDPASAPPGAAAVAPAPGDYEVLLRIQGASGESLGERREKLVLGATAPTRPWSLSRDGRRTGLRRELARQYLVREQKPLVARELELAAAEEKDPDGRLQVVASLLELGEAERAARIVLPLAEAKDAPGMAHVLAGAALALKGSPAEAAVHYEKAIAAQGDKPQVTLLNALCECYGRAGRKKEARTCFERSLALAPEQPSVKKAMASLGG